MDFDNQIRAIRYAIKELQRERYKALETNNTEWQQDTEEHIKNLTEAIEVINTMKVLKAVTTA